MGSAGQSGFRGKLLKRQRDLSTKCYESTQRGPFRNKCMMYRMPIYEYECAKCGKTIEVLQKMSDKPLKKHEGCGGALTKLISASGFQFKGTGWYVTDYARKDSRSEAREGSDSGDSKDKKDSKETKDTSSNGNKEVSSGSKAGAEKAGKKDSHSKDTKSGRKKD
jgi:putative FmdB family regulatory protein